MSRAVFFLVVGLGLASGDGRGEAPRRAHFHQPALASPRPERAPRRVVSLAPVVTETLFAVGAGELVVGVTRYCDKPAAAAELPKVGGYVDPQLERVLELEPDLVIAMPSFGQRQVLDRLRERGVPVLVGFGDTVDEVRDLIRTIAEVTNRAEGGARAVRALDEGLAAVASTTSQLTKRSRALLVFATEPLVVAGPGTFPDEALRAAGGENVVPTSAPAWPTWSVEAVLAAAPDVVVAAEGPQAAARLTALLARAGRPVRVVSGARHILMRPGPTLHEDVSMLAKLLKEGPP